VSVCARISALLLVVAYLAGSPLQAQNVLTVVERDQSGKSRPLNPAGIVDINSVLTIRIDRDTLRSRAVALTKGNPAADTLIGYLGTLAGVSDSVLAAIAPAITKWLASDKQRAAQETLLADLRGLTSAADRILSVAAVGTPLRDRLNAALESAIGTDKGLYTVLFEVTAQEIVHLRGELDRLATESGVYFQLGAWVESSAGTRAVHLAGFDVIPEAEAFDVERFGINAITLTQQQQQELERIEASAKAFNEGGLQGAAGDVLEGFRSTLSSAVVPALDSASACAGRLTGDLDSLGAALQDTLLMLATPFRETAVHAREFAGRLTALGRKYGPAGARFESGADLLVASNTDLGDVYRLAARTGTDLESSASLLSQVPAAVRSEMPGAVANIKGNAVTCAAGIRKAIGNAKELTGLPLELLTGASRTSAALADFTADVQRLSLDAVPAEVTLPLRSTGRRGDGDRLLIRAAMGQKDRDRADLQSLVVPMFRVLSYVKTTVGLVFADPFGTTELRRRFQAGPSYSILLKHGSRRSVMRNQFGLIGIGLNVAALDLDHDDNPELGLGGVISLLGDYLQSGVGYDVGQDRGYWFFGLRLPTPSGGLAGSSGSASTP
jgi:hypothetical protein